MIAQDHRQISTDPVALGPAIKRPRTTGSLTADAKVSVKQPNKSQRRYLPQISSLNQSKETQSTHKDGTGDEKRGPGFRDPLDLPSHDALLEAFGAFSEGTEPALTRREICEYAVDRDAEKHPAVLHRDTVKADQLAVAGDRLIEKRTNAINTFKAIVPGDSVEAAWAKFGKARAEFERWMEKESIWPTRELQAGREAPRLPLVC